MPVLFQHAVDDGPITLYDVWKEPVWKTLELIEWYLTHQMVFFNASFDFFHIVKCYTIWRLLPKDWIPEQHINEIAMMEGKGQDGPALKPVSTLDLMLHSRKGPYQTLMGRKDIRIRRVPTALAYALADELEQRVEIDGIYFARTHDKDAPRWQVFDIKKRDGNIDKHFKDVVLKFAPAGGLKFLAEHALGVKPKYHFKDVELDRSFWPKELGWAPTALKVSNPDREWKVFKKERDRHGNRKLAGFAWPGVIQHHIDHWAYNLPAREYATDDIVYTRGLWEHFDRPEGDDDDSVLACMVPVVRWHGFQIDRKGMKKLLRRAKAVVDASPININKPREVRAYLSEYMDENEQLIIEASTKKANITAVSKWEVEAPEDCFKCNGEGCTRCEGTGVMQPRGPVTEERGNHPAAIRAKQLLDIKVAVKEVELYKKLIKAGKFHPAFTVIGTLSSRMSGTGSGGLNAQGIKGTKEVRRMFPLAWEDRILCGGDFDSFEVTLADAVYNDPDLRKALTTKVDCHKCNATGKAKGGACEECSGSGKTTKKIHALFAMCLFPGHTYEQIAASSGSDNDMYTKGKQGVFAMVYGGDHNTLVRNLGVDVDVAQKAFDTWNKWFPQAAKARERTFKAFCSMSQPDGTHVVWRDPAPYVESFLGFRRDFSLENRITRVLYDLARKVPSAWRNCPVKVVRRDRVQTAGGAVASALYGAAFQIQAANQRAAANHEIQSPGGTITKYVQRRIWDLQPAGVHELFVSVMNIHDELMSVTHPDYVEPVAEVVEESVKHYRSQVPLLGMTWNKEMANWAEKKGGAVTLKIQPPELRMAA
ncbi:POLAc domain-containing protein [Durusdinium trenchii]|uniref:POLAc domain-containing protein n=1 Tax=Durusdinium trenchii TaxID=1381693 RepID=A0ABP0P0D5_9DINO